MVKIFEKFFKKEKKLSEEKNIKEYNNVYVQTDQTGSTGTSMYSGYIFEDYLTDMTGTRRADIFDKMSLSDYNVMMCLSAVVNPIKSANWEIVPASEDSEDIKDAELIKHILFDDMCEPFDSFLNSALDYVTFGYSLFEIVHKIVLDHPIYKSYIGIEKLAWRSQKTIETWQIDKYTEKLLSVTQITDGDSGKTSTIPSDFLLLFNHNAKGVNFEGISFLRSCYGNWMRKNLYLKLNSAGIEKYSIPTPTVEVPVGKENSSEFSTLLNVLASYTSHQKNYITYPEGWKINLNPNSGFDPSKVDVSIDNEDKRMTKAFLANFLELGMNGTGAYALSNDLSDFFLSGLQHIGNEICKKINQKIIIDLIKLNRGIRSKYPTLKVTNINDKAGQELANILASAVTSQIIIPDDNLEDHFRERFKLPKRSEEGQRLKPSPSPFGLTEKVVKALRGRNGKK